jgi:MoxR-like ATPases
MEGNMENRKQLNVPKLDPYFYLPEEAIRVLGSLEKLSRIHPVNILIVGRQGCSKSSLIHQFAACYKRPFAIFQIGQLSEPGQLFGEHALKGGDTYYQEFLFPKAITTPDCVIHLEEINRPEHPKALNELFSVLSENRSIWVDQLGLIKVAPGVVFFASMNEGEEFTGTDTLDVALRDRFYIIPVDYLPFETEKKVLVSKTGITEEDADLILKVIGNLRSDPHVDAIISVRHSLMIAELVATGAPLREALIYSLSISRDIIESMLLSVHVETMDISEKSSEYKLFL